MILDLDQKWKISCADRLDFLKSLPDGSIDAIIGSPPYESSRSYGIDFKLAGQDWVDFMVATYRECIRVCTGLTAFVVGHGKGLYEWSGVPEILQADLIRAGFHVRPTLFFHRIGVPGSGQSDWMRADVERIVCVTSKPGELPWSDNTACGHRPKWAPGGEMSNREANGRRVNQWGHSLESGGTVVEEGGVVRSRGRRPSHVEASRDKWGMVGDNRRAPNGERQKTGRRVSRGHADGDTLTSDSYDPPAIANPGNKIQESYSAAEVSKFLEMESNIKTCLVGGGVMGNSICHRNEAPYPESLAELLILSICRPGGIVLDPFAGSGTTLAVAIANGRRAIGCDVRESQCELTRRRCESVTSPLFV